MKLSILPYLLVSAILLIIFSHKINYRSAENKQAQIQIVHLSQGDTSGFEALRHSFINRNPKYDLEFYHRVNEIPHKTDYRLVFIQNGEGNARLNDVHESAFSVGDIIYLNKGETLISDTVFDALVFNVPDPLPKEIPSFIRPDWDPNITDVPGGCATETNAYRRILLTWEDKVGAYLYHALNAHRVRIMDSFTHYHPEEGGFDEFYLVQMVLPDAKLITSTKVDLITQPEKVSKDDVESLLEITILKVGDLVYIPRGVAHRGLGGVLTQVITVPGFIPGSEIGIDHHLKVINDRLSLEGNQALPLNESASLTEVIK